MKTKITVIVDNIDMDGIQGEWGLCMLVEYEEKKILVDTGASNLFAQNLRKLGFDMKDIDYATLSHAHYDHANGMPCFFCENEKAKFYLQETAGENCYFKKFIFHKYIGIPKRVMKKYANRIEMASGLYKLYDGAYLLGHSTEGLSAIGKREMMYTKTKKGWKPDDFSHEQSLILETDKGLLIINSCSHGGAVNIIHEVQKAFPDQTIYGIIGGFHLFNKAEQEIREVARAIKKTGISYVCTGHCTKERAYRIMKEELGEMISQLHVGLVIEA